MDRIRIRIVGQSGYGGLLSTGSVIAKSLEGLGFYVVSDREYPSLIKGGHSCFTLNASASPIKSLSKVPDILIALDKISMDEYFHTLRDGGTLIHGYERSLGLKKIIAEAEERNITIIHQNTLQLTREVGGNHRMQNMAIAGMTWKVLGLPIEAIENHIKSQFAHKPKVIPPNIRCANLAYERAETVQKIEFPGPENNKDTLFIEGNHAIALGAIHAGMKAYYAYPMSPSSSILTHLANHEREFGYVVKQAEDEITVANMAVGSMYGGTRALCATSGGGFDLMTETVSLAGITETPFVCVVVQRPGPGTGLPTWTGQGDLNLAIYSGHGEYGKIVLAVSNAYDAFDLIQHAFNLAEEYQVPVIVLSEKVIGENYATIPKFQLNKIPIKRGLVEGEELKNLKNTDRFKITESGVSKRWIPGSSEAYFFANGDEHTEDGAIDESESAGDMYAKRVRKLETIKANLPDPVIYGESKGADISFVGWGSTGNTLQDIIQIYANRGIKVNYLHFTYLFPLKTEKLEQFFKDNKNIHLVEGNYTGQLGRLIRQETGLQFKGKLLKWNGRPFFLEDLEEYIEQNA